MVNSICKKDKGKIFLLKYYCKDLLSAVFNNTLNLIHTLIIIKGANNHKFLIFLILFLLWICLSNVFHFSMNMNYYKYTLIYSQFTIIFLNEKKYFFLYLFQEIINIYIELILLLTFPISIHASLN